MANFKKPDIWPIFPGKTLYIESVKRSNSEIHVTSVNFKLVKCINCFIA